nr:PREDICTED: putative protein TPRXL [Equus przewalskii]
MTPARQPRQQRPLAQRSDRTSSPTATHRNRFPTSSGRVSTAIAVIAEVAAASSPARGPAKPRSYRPPMLRRADRGTAAAPRASANPGRTRRSAQKGKATSVSRSQQHSSWTPRPAASGCSSTHTKNLTEIPSRSSEPQRQPRSPPPRRGQYYSAFPSTGMAVSARASPSAGAGGGKEPRERVGGTTADGK